VKLRTESLASILEGGVSFGTLPSVTPAAVAADAAFRLYEDQDRAMRPAEIEIRAFIMYFGGTLRGLSAGAPVELHGITVGEVKSVDVVYNPNAGSLAFGRGGSISAEAAGAHAARRPRCTGGNRRRG